MWRLSRKHPGRLLRGAMKEMSRYLAGRAETGGIEETWADLKMMSYVNQIILTQHPPNAIGIRNHRELVTLGTAVDLLMSGHLPELGDLLIQRLKALEGSLGDQSWGVSRHLELIPPMAATLTSEEERKRAAKMELAQAKLKEMMGRGRGASK